MLQYTEDLYDNKLSASDGEIGRVKDVYFDDKSWAIRYLVVDTGTWLSERKVLLSPHAFGRWQRDGKVVPIKLTRAKIENSPSIDAHQPVSRQFEESYFQYYGWPAYFESNGMWGGPGFPASVPEGEESKPHHGHNQKQDIHPRSTKAVAGYEIQAEDGGLGSLKGLMFDDKTWTIRELAVETGHWYSSKAILIPVNQVKRISYDESRFFVTLTRQDIRRTMENGIAKAGS